MKHKIDPAVDCVFKAILGNENRKHLLIHFLNAVLGYLHDPAKRITDAAILNPFSDRGYETDKLNVVDVKARSANGRQFHVEIQTALHPALKERMLYAWSTMYHAQLEKGDPYRNLEPLISIWLVAGSLFPDSDVCHLPFYVLNPETGLKLSPHFAVHVLQLPKWEMKNTEITDKDRWIYLFKEGKNIDADHPPDILKNSEEMRQVMEVLKTFSENQRDFLEYQKSLEGERIRNTILMELERERRAKKQALKEKEEALKEIEKLRRLLESRDKSSE